MRWPKKSVITRPLAKSRKEAFDFCLNLWYAFMRMAMARLLDKIPTVMKMIEKKTERRFSVWQVVLAMSPAAGDTGCLELLFMDIDIVVEVNAVPSSHLSVTTAQSRSADICSIQDRNYEDQITSHLTGRTKCPSTLGWGGFAQPIISQAAEL